ncbi:MAG: hypothetical protein EBX04_06045 [Rhodobacteraceae bacterium]|nr:hypothetical protein [Paracoccaceae bacterium]
MRSLSHWRFLQLNENGQKGKARMRQEWAFSNRGKREIGTCQVFPAQKGFSMQIREALTFDELH